VAICRFVVVVTWIVIVEIDCDRHVHIRLRFLRSCLRHRSYCFRHRSCYCRHRSCCCHHRSRLGIGLIRQIRRRLLHDLVRHLDRGLFRLLDLVPLPSLQPFESVFLEFAGLRP